MKGQIVRSDSVYILQCRTTGMTINANTPNELAQAVSQNISLFPYTTLDLVVNSAVNWT